jgi:hypothetical protein
LKTLLLTHQSSTRWDLGFLLLSSPLLVAVLYITLELIDTMKVRLLIRDFPIVLMFVLIRAFMGRWWLELEDGLVSIVCDIVLLL